MSPRSPSTKNADLAVLRAEFEALSRRFEALERSWEERIREKFLRLDSDVTTLRDLVEELRRMLTDAKIAHLQGQNASVQTQAQAQVAVAQVQAKTEVRLGVLWMGAGAVVMAVLQWWLGK